MNPHVELSVAGGDWPDERQLRQIVQRALRAAREASGALIREDSEIGVMFVDDQSIRELNRKWRGIDKATNVLSFPGGDFRPGESAGPLLGDIVLAEETVRREADLDGKSLQHHLSHLIIHGFLHILGYDHDNSEEADRMEALEILALAQLGIADPYG